MKYTNTDAATPSSFAPPTPSPADPRHWTPPLSFSGVGSPSRDAIGPEPRHLARDRRVVRGEMLREDAAGCRETLYPPPKKKAEAGGGVMMTTVMMMMMMMKLLVLLMII